MSRIKKDGEYVNFYMDRELKQRIKDYADEKGQTMTTAIERILKSYLDDYKEKEGIMNSSFESSINQNV